MKNPPLQLQIWILVNFESRKKKEIQNWDEEDEVDGLELEGFELSADEP